HAAIAVIETAAPHLTAVVYRNSWCARLGASCGTRAAMTRAIASTSRSASCSASATPTEVSTARATPTGALRWSSTIGGEPRVETPDAGCCAGYRDRRTRALRASGHITLGSGSGHASGG